MFEKKKTVVTYSVERCGQCKREIRRKFRDGDYVFLEAAKCSCGGVLLIERIFGEPTG